MTDFVYKGVPLLILIRQKSINFRYHCNFFFIHLGTPQLSYSGKNVLFFPPLVLLILLYLVVFNYVEE